MRVRVARREAREVGVEVVEARGEEGGGRAGGEVRGGPPAAAGGVVKGVEVDP